MHPIFMKILLGECPGYLPQAVGPEIKTNNNVTIFYGPDWLVFIIHHYNRFNKLIRNTLVIRFLD